MAASKHVAAVVIALALSACQGQEPKASANAGLEARLHELHSLCAESGLDVSEFHDEESLLAAIAQHPPSLRALRVRAARRSTRRRSPCSRASSRARLERAWMRMEALIGALLATRAALSPATPSRLPPPHARRRD
jgi:hypothetical protein